jgi:hypothetical protein
MWWMYFDFRSKDLCYCHTTLNHNYFFVSKCNDRMKSKNGYLCTSYGSSQYKRCMSSFRYCFSNYGKSILLYNYGGIV